MAFSLVLVFSFFAGNGQSRWGIQLGGNLANEKIMAVSSSTGKATPFPTQWIEAFHVGVGFISVVRTPWAFETGLYWTGKGSQYRNAASGGPEFQYYFHPNYVEIPLVLRYDFLNLAGGACYVGWGLFGGWGIAGREQVTNLSSGNTIQKYIKWGNTSEDDYQRADLGGKGELGYDFQNKWGFSLQTEQGWSNDLPQGGGNRVQSRIWRFAFEYWFGNRGRN
ncbi:MAG: outer membrane beta-barrel protein [Chitinophagaceae bacterium]